MLVSADRVTSLAKSVVRNRRGTDDRLCCTILHHLSQRRKPRTCTSTIVITINHHQSSSPSSIIIINRQLTIIIQSSSSSSPPPVHHHYHHRHLTSQSSDIYVSLQYTEVRNTTALQWTDKLSSSDQLSRVNTTHQQLHTGTMSLTYVCVCSNHDWR